MKVYSSDGKYIIDVNESNKFDYGTYGNVFRYNEELSYKVFKHENIHKPDPIILLKNYKLENFNKIIDLLYNSKLEYSGYIMKHYEPDNFDILSNKEYLLNSVNNIYDGIMVYTKNLFEIYDLHIGNVIVNSEGITVIDVDDYKKTHSDNTYINVFRFKQMLISLLSMYIKKYNVKDPMEAHLLIRRLFEDKTNDINHFNNTMKRYSKPIDYFTKVLK